MVFRNLSSLSFDTWLRFLDAPDITRRLLVAVSGYEDRSVHWTRRVLEASPPDHAMFLVFGFEQLSTGERRQRNDHFYNDNKISTRTVEGDSAEGFVAAVLSRVQEEIANSQESRLEVAVDYSSMPRSWYCGLATNIGRAVRAQDRVSFWYTPGRYTEGEFPSAGVDDFRVFSGRASVGAQFRTHVMGLGFDRVRSQGIWSVLDPQNLVCFYANPAVVDGYVDRVLNDNRDVLLAAQHVFSLPLTDFVYSYSKIVSVVSDFRHLGDVIIVPDGPKPLILASSLVPLSMDIPGVVCFHVTRPRSGDASSVPVDAAGEPIGFCFGGSESVEASRFP